MKKIKLLITGISGTAGRALAKQALRENYIVGGTIHHNFPSELEPFRNKGLLKCYQVGLKDLEETGRMIVDFQPDAVVHLAGRVLGKSDRQVFSPQTYTENITIFKNVITGLKDVIRPPRFILSSGCLVYDRLTSSHFINEVTVQDLPKVDSRSEPYRASKLDQEKLLAESNIDYVIARPTQFTGPGKIPGVIEYYIACQILAIKEGKRKNIQVKNKLGEVDILDVRDVAKAYLTLIKKGIRGEVYHISSGSPSTVEDVAKTLLKVVGLDSSQFPIESTDNEQTVYFRFSPAKLNKLGWRPQFTLRDALTGYWEYFKNQPR